MSLIYHYTHTETIATTGFFSCEPDASYTEAELCEALEASPMDSFLHAALFRRLRKQPVHDLLKLFPLVYDSTTDTFTKPALASVLWECALHEASLEELYKAFPADTSARLAQASPLLSLLRHAVRSDSAADQEKRAWWQKLYFQNINWLTPLPSSAKAQEYALLSSEELADITASMQASESLEALYARLHPVEAPAENGFETASDLLRCASDRLLEAGLLTGCEMRHEASLAPIALLRSWNIDLQVRQKRMDYVLQGEATAYGRGLSLAQARISCCMEIVERASAYVSLEEKGQKTFVTLRKKPLPLICDSFVHLRKAGQNALDPEILGSYGNCAEYSLHWLVATDPTGREVLVPAQAVFLFFNADEPECFSATSTGLASGTSLAQAKLNALLEILERDALASMPFQRERCFLAKSRNPRLQALLDDYAARNIRLQFQDLTHEFGLPVLSAFVRAEDGSLVRAQACKLSGAEAALAALTETPWPYCLTQPAPYGRATGAGLAGLSERYLEDLPAYSFFQAEQALQFVEARLLSLGRTPLYVDITRADLDFPVARAFLPGLESSDDSQSVPCSRFQWRVLCADA